MYYELTESSHRPVYLIKMYRALSNEFKNWNVVRNSQGKEEDIAISIAVNY